MDGERPRRVAARTGEERAATMERMSRRHWRVYAPPGPRCVGSARCFLDGTRQSEGSWSAVSRSHRVPWTGRHVACSMA